VRDLGVVVQVWVLKYKVWMLSYKVWVLTYEVWVLTGSNDSSSHPDLSINPLDLQQNFSISDRLQLSVYLLHYVSTVFTMAHVILRTPVPNSQLHVLGMS